MALNLPPNLFPAPPAGTEDHFNPRPISLEEAFGRQNDRLGYLRSMGLPWAEAVFQLRDLLVGLEDEEFWDGIPDSRRKAMQKMTEAEAEKERQLWAVEGWNGYPCRAVPGPQGRPIFKPTPENLSHAYQIVMRLAARRSLTWRTKRVSSLQIPGQDLPSQQ